MTSGRAVMHCRRGRRADAQAIVAHDEDELAGFHACGDNHVGRARVLLDIGEGLAEQGGQLPDHLA